MEEWGGGRRLQPPPVEPDGGPALPRRPAVARHPSRRSTPPVTRDPPVRISLLDPKTGSFTCRIGDCPFAFLLGFSSGTPTATVS